MSSTFLGSEMFTRFDFLPKLPIRCAACLADLEGSVERAQDAAVAKVSVWEEIRPWLAVCVAARSGRNAEDPGVFRALTSGDYPTRPELITKNALTRSSKIRLESAQALPPRPASRPVTHPHPPGALREIHSPVSTSPRPERPRILRLECAKALHRFGRQSVVETKALSARFATRHNI